MIFAGSRPQRTFALAQGGPKSRSVRCNVIEQSAEPAQKPPSPDDLVWDPKGLLANSPKQPGLLERKLALRKAAQAQTNTVAAPDGPPIKRLSMDALKRGGLAYGEEEPGFSWDELSHLQVDLTTPRLRLLNIDPPVFTIDKFLDSASCVGVMLAATQSGKMQQSGIGKGALFSEENSYSSRRTSSSLLLDDAVLRQSPQLKELSDHLQAGVRSLFTYPAWAPAGRLPPPGHVCFEGLQLARYDAGQHFLAHEDGFPLHMARDNGFQRSATVLLYLNSVPRGGRTVFEHLGLAIEPVRGRALLFFPGFADGSPDARTLHSAQAAIDPKWVAQQWVARAMPPPPPRAPANSRGKGSPVKGSPVQWAQPVAVSVGKGVKADVAARIQGAVSRAKPQAKPVVDEDELPAERMRRLRKEAKEAKKAKPSAGASKASGQRP